MSPEEIKAALARPAVEFAAGGFRPTYAATESWLGRVHLGRPGETLPLDAQGRPMWPLVSDAKAQLNIVDGGTIFLAKNAATGEWEFYCDFF